VSLYNFFWPLSPEIHRQSTGDEIRRSIGGIPQADTEIPR